MARRSALARRLKAGHPPPPFAGTILDAMDAAGLTGPTWDAWRTFWRAVYALPMDAADLERFTRHTGRTVPPPAPVREAWLIVGRRGGKSRSAALAALYAAIGARLHAPPPRLFRRLSFRDPSERPALQRPMAMTVRREYRRLK